MDCCLVDLPLPFSWRTFSNIFTSLFKRTRVALERSPRQFKNPASNIKTIQTVACLVTVRWLTTVETICFLQYKTFFCAMPKDKRKHQYWINPVSIQLYFPKGFPRHENFLQHIFFSGLEKLFNYTFYLRVLFTKQW